MTKLRFGLFILLVLSFGFGLAQLGRLSELSELSEEQLSEVLEAIQTVYGEMKVVDAGEGIIVLEKSKGGTTPDGDVIESGLVVESTKIVKFKDGRTTCYMLADGDEATDISCVRTSFP